MTYPQLTDTETPSLRTRVVKGAQQGSAAPAGQGLLWLWDSQPKPLGFFKLHYYDEFSVDAAKLFPVLKGKTPPSVHRPPPRTPTRPKQHSSASH